MEPKADPVVEWIDHKIQYILETPFAHTDTYIGAEASINALQEVKLVALGFRPEQRIFDSARRKVNNNVKHSLAEHIPGRRRGSEMEDLRSFVQYFDDRIATRMRKGSTQEE